MSTTNILEKCIFYSDYCATILLCSLCLARMRAAVIIHSPTPDSKMDKFA